MDQSLQDPSLPQVGYFPKIEREEVTFLESVQVL